MDAGKEINQLPVCQVEINRLRTADSPRLSGEDPEHVEALVAAQSPLPPIIVHRPTMRVIDGVHRLRAAIRRGETTIAARYFDGGNADAFVLAVRLNVAHGLPLALADRKRAAERVIGSYPQWSDRRVASVTGISAGTVAEIRRRTAGLRELGSRVGQDGRVRPLDGTTGRMLAGQLMTEKPHLSLRQVARAATISPETARDVRNRLRNGEDLIPAKSRRARASAVASGPGADLVAVPRAEARRARRAVPDRAAVVNRLKSDPALRYSETGRNLLRLLTLHTVWTEEWDGIVTNLPPHCNDTVADLAREFAALWADLATRAGRDIDKNVAKAC